MTRKPEILSRKVVEMTASILGPHSAAQKALDNAGKREIVFLEFRGSILVIPKYAVERFLAAFQ